MVVGDLAEGGGGDRDVSKKGCEFAELVEIVETAYDGVKEID